MNAAWEKIWNHRSPREKAVIVWAALIVAILAYLCLLQSAGQARTKLRASIATLQGQAARLNAHVAEYEALRSAPPAPRSTTDLRVLLDARIRDAGLSAALVRIETVQSNQVRVVFGAVPFADWLAWVVNLRAQQVRIEQTRIEALSSPGMVSVTATFTRSRP